MKYSIIKSLEAAGWTPESCPGYSKSLCLYSRTRALASVLPFKVMNDSVRLSSLTRFGSIASLESCDKSLVIGFDSEWQDSSPREMLSWQFSILQTGENGLVLKEIIIFNRDLSHSVPKNDISIEQALGSVLDSLGVEKTKILSKKRYSAIVGISKRGKPVEETFDRFHEARDAAKYYFVDGVASLNQITDSAPPSADWKPTKGYYDVQNSERMGVTLVAHNALADISSFNQTAKLSKKSVLTNLTSAGGGVFSSTPAYFNLKSPVNPQYFYALKVDVRDTMTFAPVGSRKLSDLGQAIGLPKLEDKIIDKTNMRALLETDPVLFAEYASRDATIALLYSSSLFGINTSQPVTLLTSCASIAKQSIASHLGVDPEDSAEFLRKYRGLEKVKHGKTMDAYGLVPVISPEPINHSAGQVISYAEKAYHGGYNACAHVGSYAWLTTFDFDLKNAYPTAMCLVPDIDWSDPIEREIHDVDLTVDTFDTCSPWFLAYCSFAFPADVKYPSIMINDDGVPVYLRTSEGLDGVYASGPEIYVALRLGARVHVKTGFFLRPLRRSDGTESYSLRSVVKDFVSDRTIAKNTDGKNSLADQVLKLMVNGLYGKVAQNVSPKRNWCARSKKMESIGDSPVTNPVSACFITAIVRATLLAAANQVEKLGFRFFSVTTDGFISDIPLKTLESLDLFGFTEFLARSRRFLTDGESQIWETKHAQDDLLNICTRGNVSLRCAANPFEIADVETGEVAVFSGVCAHNSYKTGVDPSDEQYEFKDRLEFMTAVLGREGALPSVTKHLTSLKEMVQTAAPYGCREITRNIRMDFDLKRKPVRSSFNTVRPIVEGLGFAIVNFSTEPFENIDEFRRYRRKKADSVCLRTSSDWEDFWNRVELKDGEKIGDVAWKKVQTVMMMYRSGLIDIPSFDNMRESEKIDVFNAVFGSVHKIRKSDWDNAKRASRLSRMRPVEEVIEEVSKLRNFFSENKNNTRKEESYDS